MKSIQFFSHFSLRHLSANNNWIYVRRMLELMIVELIAKTVRYIRIND